MLNGRIELDGRPEGNPKVERTRPKFKDGTKWKVEAERSRFPSSGGLAYVLRFES